MIAKLVLNKMWTKEQHQTISSIGKVSNFLLVIGRQCIYWLWTKYFIKSLL